MDRTPEQILGQMTLEEKASLVNGGSFFGMRGIERLGVERLQVLDGGTGMNFEQFFGDFYSQKEALESTNGMVGSSLLSHVIENFYEPEKLSEEEIVVYNEIREFLLTHTGEDYAPGCFPPGILLGATFNPEVVREVGRALGREAKLFGVHFLLGTPNVNIHRDPKNGRLFEGYSEDPHVVSALAPELVKGVQEYGVAANVKHFAANNQETNRVGINETISERTLREIYLPGFEACVKEGGVKTVMSAYNKINGVACSENKWLLTELLREEWGFDGSVVSDWGAVYHPVEALAAGNDLAMPGPISGDTLVQAVKEGRLDESVLDTAVLRLLNLIAFCTQDIEKDTDLQKLQEDTDRAAYRAATEGIVLLKNENGIFPLKEGTRVAVMGSGAKSVLACGSGSAGITTDRTSSIAESLTQFLGEDRVTVIEQTYEDLEQLREILTEKKIDTVIFSAVVGGMEGNDREDLHLSLDDTAGLLMLETIQDACGKTVKDACGIQIGLVLNTCGPVDIRDFEDGLDGVWAMFLPGMKGGEALVDLMTGKVCPSGKLPLTFPVRYEDAPTSLHFPGEGYEAHYGEGIYVGYRYYDKKKIKPQYAFGYGLSYTEFVIDNFRFYTADGIEIEEEETPHFLYNVSFAVDIANTGNMPGAQVIQIYVEDECSTLPKPVKELKAFEKVFLQPGEKKTVLFALEERDFASYDMDYHKWMAEEGWYHILVATSAAPEDILMGHGVYYAGKNEYSYGLHSTVKTMYEVPDLKNALQQLWQAKGWDWKIIESNYQYTPNRILQEIVPEGELEQTMPEVQVFMKAVDEVVKP